MSWGYHGLGGRSLQEAFSSSKTLINQNDIANIYKSTAKYNTLEIILHDARKSNHKSMAILKDNRFNIKKCIDVTDHFKTFKEVYNYIVEVWDNLLM
jgi:hypothetical protein